MAIRGHPMPSNNVIPLDRNVSGAVSDDALIEMWLSGRTTNTRRAYEKDIERFRRHAGKALCHVTAADLVSYAESLAHLAIATQHRRLSSVKSLYTFAHRLGYVRFDPAAALGIPKAADNRAGKLLPREVVRRIIDAAAPGRDKLILWTLYLTGVRESELIALRASDIHRTPTGYALSVTGKGGKVRNIAIKESLARALMDHRDTGILFQTVRGNRLNASDVYRVVTTAGERAGHRVTPHLLRHAHASHALDNNAPLALVRDSLGHSSLSTTSIYVHAKPTDGASLYLDDDLED